MLRISRALYDEVIGYCQRAYPKEACGVLAGRIATIVSGGQERAAVWVYPMDNVEQSAIGYQMNPSEQLLVMKQMRQREQEMIGIYHSHTASAAYPSPVDVSLAISPDISYVLVSLKNREHPQLKSYHIDDNRVTEEDVVIGEPQAGPGQIYTR
jgi:proteasome lid subunit RPN8/RPN11